MVITANDARRGNPLRPAIWGGAALLLLLPAVAMQFTAEMNWGAEDFLAMALLLLAACGGYELAARLTGSAKRRALAGAAIALLFLLAWAELAVGLFD